tara:strand:- start:23415 stop:23921 length:507 start_codon:yes stop_codon:yes gene_type:complete
MEKFLSVPVFKLLANGTTTSGTANKLTDSSATFVTDNVQVGDIVHNSTDNTYTTVTAVDSQTVLSVGTTVPTSKAYFIHSDTLSNNQLVSCGNIGLIEQASTSTVTITYDDVAAVDVVTLVHTPVAAGSEYVRDQIEDFVVTALQTHWKDVAHDITIDPFRVIGISIG